jgi:hypothetical protein
MEAEKPNILTKPRAFCGGSCTKSHHYLFTFTKTTHAINTMYCMFFPYCASKKIFSPLQVKNKRRDGELGHAFILGSMDCTVANNTYCYKYPGQVSSLLG